MAVLRTLLAAHTFTDRPPPPPPPPPMAEGNLHGILVGREVLPDGILYASRETHYSVFKAGRMYRMDAVKVGGCTALVLHKPLFFRRGPPHQGA